MEKSRYATVLALSVIGIQISGCASIIKGSSAAINVTTPPVTGATCTLSSSQGSWQLVSPASVTVERSKNDIQVRCTKEGYQDASAVIPSNFEGWTVGNLIFGGVIGVGVDAATGALNDYPNAFQVPMFKLDPALSTPVVVPETNKPNTTKPKSKPGT
ncbi:MAG: hypothetical protein ABL973_01775 [Micropepsaceae bacterium]